MSSRNRKLNFINPLTTAVMLSAVLASAAAAVILWYFWPETDRRAVFTEVRTLAGLNREFVEPFGVAFRGGTIYISDGEADKIWQIDEKGIPKIFAGGLNTPSGLAFNDAGELFVADTGSHTIKKIDPNGTVTTVAGSESVSGSADGEASAATFNGPIGIAIKKDGAVYVSDTYNDRIRVIENGNVRTLAGNRPGYAEGIAETVRFHTPLGIAFIDDEILLVADSGNGRIRTVDPNGVSATLAGGGHRATADGSLLSARFRMPTAITVDADRVIYIADGNAIRVIGRRAFPIVETITDRFRGYSDGPLRRSKFNRPSGIAVAPDGGLIVADSENQTVRVLTDGSAGTAATSENIEQLRFSAEEFRSLAPGRWPYDPPGTKRDIAGTLGEIRGEIVDETSEAWFHNGLDIAGGYGETARFVRDEKVLMPNATANFGTLRELLRMPTLGYIHIRLGRDPQNVPFDDTRFNFEKDPGGKLIRVRIARGTKFRAGEAVGTLNSMNHVHLVAGRSGAELNALNALELPNVSDGIAPIIEEIKLFDENGSEIETAKGEERIKLRGKTHVVVRSFDRMDGNPERRRLGLYRVGYDIFPAGSLPEAINWTISFEKMPSESSVHFVYAPESHSGATGVTIFNYIVTNRVDGGSVNKGFIDPAELLPGNYTIRTAAADRFGNVATKEIPVEVIR